MSVSPEYKVFLEKVCEIEQTELATKRGLMGLETQKEELRKEYSKNCDHPITVCKFPVCGVCYQYIGKKE